MSGRRSSSGTAQRFAQQAQDSAQHAAQSAATARRAETTAVQAARAAATSATKANASAARASSAARGAYAASRAAYSSAIAAGKDAAQAAHEASQALREAIAHPPNPPAGGGGAAGGYGGAGPLPAGCLQGEGPVAAWCTTMLCGPGMITNPDCNIPLNLGCTYVQQILSSSHHDHKDEDKYWSESRVCSAGAWGSGAGVFGLGLLIPGAQFFIGGMGLGIGLASVFVC
ncbi:hypothetical protein ACFXPA_10040 [Amycolatopsis sp. NPDC059090]|uniref:hypothetical protein n=1 Tax=unclassified Amycolatopsis TaxID=2618356 RepID=UPI00366E881A